MSSIDKVQFFQGSGFDVKSAMELANLLEVAYDEYEVWDYHETKLPKEKRQLPPEKILCSSDFVDLSDTTVALCEKIDPKEIPDKKLPERKAKDSYGELDQKWGTKNVNQYDRITNFWVTEWWWLSLLDVPFQSSLLRENLGDLFESILHREQQGLNNLLQLGQQHGRELLDGFTDRVVDDQLFGFVARKTNSNEIFIVFRGTREQAEWLNNFRPTPKIFLENEKDKFGYLGEVRNGFNKIYTDRQQGKQPTIEASITQLFENGEINNDSQIFITGHSLGAALATLAALHIKKIAGNKAINPSINLYTFASPRVGNKTFAENFNAIQCYRIVNSEDLIQALPFPTTQVVDEAIFESMSPERKARTLWVRGTLEVITNGQSKKGYQHVGVPITFTKQTDSVAGNHNLSHTYREALNV